VIQPLTGRQYDLLTKALLDAFPRVARLREFARFRFELNLDAIAMGDDLHEIVFKLIGVAEADGWTPKLIMEARNSKPGNPKLFAFAQQFELAVSTLPRRKLERVIKKANSFLDVTKWRTKLGELENRVCRIEIHQNGHIRVRGTGFLVGSEAVMTNYHVMQEVINAKQLRAAGKWWAKAEQVVLRFDYKQLADGQRLNQGTEYRLTSEEWLIDYSPESRADYYPEPKPLLPQPNELDYALLRVEGKPGDQTIGKQAEPGAAKRGWIEVPTQGYEVEAGAPLLILQHPATKPLQLALETDAIIGLNQNHTRLTYKTNSEGGSSGSPCFNINWELVALHHAGDPNFERTHHPTYNQGIPLTAILKLLEERGLEDELGEQED
jgi:hypothetical protein